MDSEKLLSQNIKNITPSSIINELKHVNVVYENYIAEVESFIDSLDDIVRDIDSFYKKIYILCLSKINGLEVLSNVGHIFIYIIRYLKNIKHNWIRYNLRLHTFLNILKKYTSQIVFRINTYNDHNGPKEV